MADKKRDGPSRKSRKSKTAAAVTSPDHLTEIVANAIDFLTLATEEFGDRSKHSVIAFYTAVELMLKARLMEEHWSLVVGKDADMNKFKSGD